ncbi:XrtA system polysaccharide chain length determinant [Aliagarivorans marinus]|uniref:XrtA system polysaccharide chain length determinant n=1 Tax=Aliagarivorans marinus TaxID=561965 RepID=UPI0003FF8F02|nr:XrtA system polysaccharide chain length determinant [Aliagarivorans marinus]
MQEQLDDLLHYLRGVWLKRRYILIATWLLCPIGWVMVTMMPNQYTSEARVYADTRSMLKPLLRGLALDTDPGQELALVVRTLLSSSNLEKIARASDADLYASTSQEYLDLLDSLKADIKIAQSDKERLYTIKFTGSSPKQVQSVVQAVLDVFVENTLGAKRLDSDQATVFINQQIDDYETRLSQAEKRLADFKREYAGLLPGSERGYYSNLEEVQNQLEETRLQVSEVETRLVSARVQLSSEEAIVAQAREQVSTEYDDRLLALQTRLDELNLRYTERHPDVVEINRQIIALQKQQQLAITSATASTALLQDSVVYQGLKIKVSELESELASLLVREARFQSRLDEWQAKAEQVPDVEAKLTGLNRNYQITKTKYEELLARREQALISQSAGETTDDIKFRVVDPPLIPNKPSGPPRPLLIAGVLIASFGVGIGVSFLVSQINPVVTNVRQLYQLTEFPVLGVVTATAASGLEKHERRKTNLFVILNMILLCVFALVFAANVVPSLQKTVMQIVQEINLL